VVNATGLGEDRPGGPSTAGAGFPPRGRGLGAELPRRPPRGGSPNWPPRRAA